MGVASTGTGWLGLLTKCQLCVWSHGSSKYWHWLAWSPYQMSVVCVVTWEWQELALVGQVTAHFLSHNMSQHYLEHFGKGVS